jgi:hypothetical protein
LKNNSRRNEKEKGERNKQKEKTHGLVPYLCLYLCNGEQSKKNGDIAIGPVRLCIDEKQRQEPNERTTDLFTDKRAKPMKEIL